MLCGAWVAVPANPAGIPGIPAGIPGNPAGTRPSKNTPQRAKSVKNQLNVPQTGVEPARGRFGLLSLPPFAPQDPLMLLMFRSSPA